MGSFDEQRQPAGRRRPRITISDVSAALGLTKSTVSRALNGYPDISSTTRERVRRTAARMGYRPLSHAQAIRTGRARALGLVIQIDDHDAHRPFLADFLAGISFVASGEGWTITVATADGEAATLATMRRLLDEHKVDGFILARTLVEDPRIALLRSQDVPFVMFGRTRDPEGCAWYDIRSEDAMADAVRRLAALGHRRIAFVNGGLRYQYSRLRLEGFRRGLAKAGLDEDPALVRSGALVPGEGEEAAEALLGLERPPTAVVFAVDAAALGLYRAVRRHGLQVARHVSVLGYDGTPDGSHADPPLTTYAVDIRRAGERLARMLIERVRGADPEGLRETAPATFVDRGSIAPPEIGSGDLARLLAAGRPIAPPRQSFTRQSFTLQSSNRGGSVRCP